MKLKIPCPCGCKGVKYSGIQEGISCDFKLYNCLNKKCGTTRYKKIRVGNGSYKPNIIHVDFTPKPDGGDAA